MRACKISISTELLFNLIGLDNASNITIYKATTNELIGIGNTITLYITGERNDIPEVESGKKIPEATIICKTVQSHIEVI